MQEASHPSLTLYGSLLKIANLYNNVLLHQFYKCLQCKTHYFSETKVNF